MNLKLALLCAPLVAVGCAVDESTDETTSALTSVIPASDTCNQGVGASLCVQAPPIVVANTSRWTVDGVRAPLEYAGSVSLPFATDDLLSPVGGARIGGLGTVRLQRVTLAPPLVAPRNYLFVFLENIHVRRVTSGPQAVVNLYLDYSRFDGIDGFVHDEDRRFVVDLSSGTAVTVQRPVGLGSSTTWTAASASGILFAAGGCTTVTTSIARCNGELRIPLATSAVDLPAPGLAPGVGFMVRAASINGMAPDLPLARYAPSGFTRTDWQTVLFTRPRGFELSIATWNVRRFESLFESSGFGGVDRADIGTFLSGHDIVAIQEGWNRKHVEEIFAAANAKRAADGKPLFALHGPIDYEPEYSEVLATVVDAASDTQGGLWVMTHLPIANKGYKIYDQTSCRGEDCFKAKGVQWLRVMVQDEEDFEPKCRRSPLHCNKAPSGDDFVDLFNTHLQATAPLLCTLSGWPGMKAELIALIALIVNPGFALEVAQLLELVEADLNCDTQTDADVRAKQIATMNAFITAVAAPDRSSIVVGDFNIDGKTTAKSEYVQMLVGLHIASPSTSSSDLISVLPPNGFEVKHGDVVREMTSLDFTTGRCIGTFIDETGGIQDAGCPFAGNTDAPERFDYVLVRPPVLAANATDYPRWLVMTVPNAAVWASPFPSTSGNFAASPPLRLSDHKPVISALSFARLSNPPKYNPTWRHTVTQRIVSVDATNIGDCIGCGEVDPYAHLWSTIQPGVTGPAFTTSECTDNQATVFGDDACMANWVRTRPHTPPNETAIDLRAKVRDDDNTSGDDTISLGTRSTWNYNTGTFVMSQVFLSEVEVSSSSNPEAVPISRCAGATLGVEVCHAIELTPIPPGQ